MNETDIKQIVEPILKLRLAGFGYEDVIVRADEDHDGDSVLFIKLYFNAGDRLLGGERTIGISDGIRAILDSVGEYRFPHMRWNYIKGNFPADDKADETLFADATPDVL